MKLDLTSYSIVILGKRHNPTILNPDFLRHTGIIKDTLTPKDVLCTLAVSHVVYNGGLSIVAESERLQFIDENVVTIPYDSQIPTIATRYLNVLPHVNYTAAGINFTGHYVYETRQMALAFLKKTFIKEGPWLNLGSGLTEAGLKFVYYFDDVSCTISLEVTDIAAHEHDSNDSEVQNRIIFPKAIPAIDVKANYHLDAKEAELKTIKTFILSWQTCFERLVAFLDDVFGIV
ncbi:MAG: hypothetical protein HQL61_09415 [Magnetococcales bacterium]|nr:hypothetical protein [Nitrospirota bacterium]